MTPTQAQGPGEVTPPRLIALDLDGTLLDSAKRLTPRNRAALEAAAARGIHIVPTTGRFFDAMPECVRDLPFVRYAITCNGAAIYDRAERRNIRECLIPLKDAIAMLDVFARFDLICDCYMDDWGWNSQSNVAKANEYAPDEHYARMIREVRTHVPDLRAHLRETGHDVQKLLVYAKDPGLYGPVVAAVKSAVPGIVATASNSRMFEFNAPGADKGTAIACLAADLGFGIEATMAFGDGLNDLTMVRDAGTGVAMTNAEPEVIAAAKIVAPSNDDDGVAVVIEQTLNKAPDSP